jgi:DNA/RNA endonuclease YhcR with UshA esterase domain
VTAPPGLLGRRVLYLGDESAGVRVYMAHADTPAPAWGLGETVAALGRLSQYRGERQLTVERASDLWPMGPGALVPPVRGRTGTLGEPLEGRLVALAGRVVGTNATGFTLDDGSGAARIVLPGTARQGQARLLRRGQRLTVIGLVSQAAARAPWRGGYRLLLRGAADLVLARASTPARTQNSRSSASSSSSPW